MEPRGREQTRISKWRCIAQLRRGFNLSCQGTAFVDSQVHMGNSPRRKTYVLLQLSNGKARNSSSSPDTSQKRLAGVRSKGKEVR